MCLVLSSLICVFYSVICIFGVPCLFDGLVGLDSLFVASTNHLFFSFLTRVQLGSCLTQCMLICWKPNEQRHLRNQQNQNRKPIPNTKGKDRQTHPNKQQIKLPVTSQTSSSSPNRWQPSYPTEPNNPDPQKCQNENVQNWTAPKTKQTKRQRKNRPRTASKKFYGAPTFTMLTFFWNRQHGFRLVT